MYTALAPEVAFGISQSPLPYILLIKHYKCASLVCTGRLDRAVCTRKYRTVFLQEQLHTH